MWARREVVTAASLQAVNDGSNRCCKVCLFAAAMPMLSSHAAAYAKRQ